MKSSGITDASTVHPQGDMTEISLKITNGNIMVALNNQMSNAFRIHTAETMNIYVNLSLDQNQPT